MKNKVIVKRGDQFMLDQVEKEEILSDMVIDDPYIKRVHQYLRLSNSVEICVDGWVNSRSPGIDVKYKGENLYWICNIDIVTVLSTINSFKDYSKKELEDLLEEKLNSKVKSLKEDIVKLKNTKEILESNVFRLKKLKILCTH